MKNITRVVSGSAAIAGSLTAMLVPMVSAGPAAAEPVIDQEQCLRWLVDQTTSPQRQFTVSAFNGCSGSYGALRVRYKSPNSWTPAIEYRDIRTSYTDIIANPGTLIDACYRMINTDGSVSLSRKWTISSGFSPGPCPF